MGYFVLKSAACGHEGFEIPPENLVLCGGMVDTAEPLTVLFNPLPHGKNLEN